MVRTTNTRNVHSSIGNRLLTLMAVLTVIAVLVNAPTSSAQIQNPVVTGTSFIPADRVSQLFKSLPVDSARQVLLREYSADGFLDASVDVDTSSLVRVHEGVRYTIDSIAVLPDSLATLIASTVESIRQARGQFFSSTRMDAALLRMVGAMNAAGYPLASARVSNIDINPDRGTVGVEITISANDKVIIREVQVRGNTTTKTSLIITAAAIPKDAVFTDELADKIRSRLRRLNLFNDIGAFELYKKSDTVYGLLITVTEGDQNSFDGVIGYLPPISPGQSGTITGLVNVSLRNIFGTARRLAVRWNRQTKSSQELEFKYGEPFLFSLPLDLDIGYLQHQESETPQLLSYVQRVVHADLNYGLSDIVFVRLGGSFDETLPQADSLQPCSRQYLSASAMDATVGLTYDTRSNLVSPTSGARASLSYSLGEKTIRGPSFCVDTTQALSDSRRKTEFDLDGYFAIGSQFVLATGIHGSDIQGGLTDESDLFRFGGQSTVRGYQENLIRAARRAWTNIEPRFLLSSSSYVAAFFDVGYYQRPILRTGSSVAIEEIIFGYGVGLQIETPLGLAKVSFAIPKGESIDQGKVFVGLANNF